MTVAELETQLPDEMKYALAIGCPSHGPRAMDWDDDGVYCVTCDYEQTTGNARVTATLVGAAGQA